MGAKARKGSGYVWGGKMLNKAVNKAVGSSQSLKTVRIGLIVTSWAFMVLGFVLTHNA